MYPWLTRLARVLTKALGVSVLVTGATLLVWLAASALSSPTASAQTVPPPAGGSSPSSPSTKHVTSSSTRDAQNRQAMDDQMYKHTAESSQTKKASAGKGTAKRHSDTSVNRDAEARQAQDDEVDKAARKAEAAKRAAAAKRSAQNRQNMDNAMDKAAREADAARNGQNRQAMDNEVDKAAKAEAAKKAAAAKRSAQNRQNMDNAMDKAAREADAARNGQNRQAMDNEVDKAAKAEAAKKAAAAKRSIQNRQNMDNAMDHPDAVARQAMDDEMYDSAQAAAAKRAEEAAGEDRWIQQHPYEVALWESHPDWMTPGFKCKSDEPCPYASPEEGYGLNADSVKDWPDTAMYVEDENMLCNPGGVQTRSATDEEGCSQLFARNNPHWIGLSEGHAKDVGDAMDDIDGTHEAAELGFDQGMEKAMEKYAPYLKSGNAGSEPSESWVGAGDDDQ